LKITAGGSGIRKEDPQKKKKMPEGKETTQYAGGPKRAIRPPRGSIRRTRKPTLKERRGSVGGRREGKTKDDLRGASLLSELS